jgi:predicted DNA-binding transcriptional regulator AlpA
MSQLPQYIDEGKVSQITGVALSTLRNNRSRGQGIPYIKIGRSVRYDLQDVIEFMESHKIETEKCWENQ